jgi:hypothetical protein
MSDMMFDQQHDARIGFGEATVNTRTSAKPAALRHEPSSRAELVCQWHSAQGPLTCTWTEVPSTPPGGACDLRLPELAREDHFTCASGPESPLQVVSRWIAMTVLLTSAALGWPVSMMSAQLCPGPRRRSPRRVSSRDSPTLR